MKERFVSMMHELIIWVIMHLMLLVHSDVLQTPSVQPYRLLLISLRCLFLSSAMLFRTEF